MILAGKLNHKVQILRQSETGVDDGYTVTYPYEVHTTTWASIKPSKGNERPVSDQIVAEASHLITIRWMADIKVMGMIRYGTREFNINSIVNPYEGRSQLQLYCTEVIDD